MVDRNNENIEFYCWTQKNAKISSKIYSTCQEILKVLKIYVFVIKSWKDFNVFVSNMNTNIESWILYCTDLCRFFLCKDSIYTGLEMESLMDCLSIKKEICECPVKLEKGDMMHDEVMDSMYLLLFVYTKFCISCIDLKKIYFFFSSSYRTRIRWWYQHNLWWIGGSSCRNGKQQKKKRISYSQQKGQKIIGPFVGANCVTRKKVWGCWNSIRCHWHRWYFD